VVAGPGRLRRPAHQHAAQLAVFLFGAHSTLALASEKAEKCSWIRAAREERTEFARRTTDVADRGERWFREELLERMNQTMLAFPLRLRLHCNHSPPDEG